jgi:hypothetical protein
MPESSKTSNRYLKTQFATSAIMVVVTAATLAKIFLQTRKQEGRFRIVFAIVGIGLLAWFMLFVAQFADSAWITGICTQYISMLDLGFWLFAWSYFLGITEQANGNSLSSRQLQIANLANFTVFFISGFLALFNAIATTRY